MSDPMPELPRAIIEATRRRLSRRLAACVASAMAEEDFSKAQIAERLNVAEANVTAWLDDLLAGTASQLGPVCGMLAAMGRELTFGLPPIPESGVGREEKP